MLDEATIISDVAEAQPDAENMGQTPFIAADGEPKTSAEAE